MSATAVSYTHLDVYKRQGFITLTDSGRQIAEMIYERHELLSECLEKLGVDKEIAAEDACRIEAVTGRNLLIRANMQEAMLHLSLIHI